MGSEFYSYAQAAEKLGKSKKTVQNYVRKGLVRKTVRGRTTLLNKEDVDSVAEDIGSGLPPLDRKSFTDLSSRVRRLEELMAVVKEILDIHDKPLRPGKAAAVGLYNAAEKALVSGPWQSAEVDLWATQFLHFDETTVEEIGKAVPDPNPWRPFLLLCGKLVEQVARSYEKSPTLELERAYARLDKGRDRLRSLAVIWVELGHGTTQETLLRSLGTDRDNLFKKLKAKKEKT